MRAASASHALPDSIPQVTRPSASLSTTRHASCSWAHWMSVSAAVILISTCHINGPEIKPVAGMFAHAIALRKLTILQAEVRGDGLCLRAHTPRTRTHAHPYDSAACVTPELLRMSVTRLAASHYNKRYCLI